GGAAPRAVRGDAAVGGHAAAVPVDPGGRDGAGVHRRGRDRPARALHLRLRGGGGEVPPRPRRRRDPRGAPVLGDDLRQGPGGLPRRADRRARREARPPGPVQVWRDVMDRYFPGGGWLRVRRETIDALQRFKAARTLPTWDDAIAQLLKEAGEEGS